MKDNSIGFEIRTLSNLLKRRMFDNAPIPDGNRPTEMQGMVIDFLFQNRDKAVYQRDVEARFSIRRSTASGILRLMELKGIIIRESVAEDARLKRLTLTEETIDIHEAVENKIHQVEAQMADGITPEELEVFFQVIQKIKGNLE